MSGMFLSHLCTCTALFLLLRNKMTDWVFEDECNFFGLGDNSLWVLRSRLYFHCTHHLVEPLFIKRIEFIALNFHFCNLNVQFIWEKKCEFVPVLLCWYLVELPLPNMEDDTHISWMKWRCIALPTFLDIISSVNAIWLSIYPSTCVGKIQTHFRFKDAALH